MQGAEEMTEFEITRINETEILRRTVEALLALPGATGLHVDYGDETDALHNSTDLVAIEEACFAVDQVHLYLTRPAMPTQWVWFIWGNGNHGLDAIIDYTVKLKEALRPVNHWIEQQELSNRSNTMNKTIYTAAAALLRASCSATPAYAATQPPTPAKSENVGLCKSIGTLAATIMELRQEGGSYATMYQSAVSNESERMRNLVTFMVTQAFEVPRYKSDRYRSDAVADFRNQWELVCIKQFA
jgi:hypothetical protein